ncbi:hypothetical protein [Sphingomonas aracearum]|nr:hypothetical protein [Sphingomonas aracearum]
MVSRDMLIALRTRWKLVLATLVVVLAFALAWLATAERTYIARSSLLFDDRGPSGSLQDTPVNQDSRAVVGTQADILRSEAVARRVIRDQNLTDDPRLRREWRQQAPAGISIQRWLTSKLLAQLDVQPEKDTNVLAIRFRSDDPVFAARMANAFASAFVAMRLEISTGPAKQYAAWFQQRTDEVRRNLERAQSAVTAFQNSHGMVDGNALALEADRLSSLSTQLASAESGAADLRARAGTQVLQSPDVQSAGVIEALRQQVATADAKVNELATTHGDAHPALVALRNERDTLRAKLTSETAAAGRSLRVASAAASSREGELKRLVGQQRGRMLAMTGNQAQLEKLQNEVNTAQRAYEAVTQRLNIMRLQTGLPTTNVQQVDRATPPLLPASPVVPLLLLFALLGGTALGIVLVILLELARPLVRTSGGLADALGVPVLGSFALATASHSKGRF